MSEQGEKVTVEIFDQQYHIRGNVSSNYIRMIASIVDDQMKRLSTANPRLDSLQLAVLTAVNFADQYEQLKREYDDLLKQLEELRRDPDFIQSQSMEAGAPLSSDRSKGNEE